MSCLSLLASRICKLTFLMSFTVQVVLALRSPSNSCIFFCCSLNSLGFVATMYVKYSNFWVPSCFKKSVIIKPTIVPNFFYSGLFMWKRKLFPYFLLKCSWSGKFWRVIAGIQSPTAPWFQLQSHNVKKCIVWSLPLRCLKNEGLIEWIVWACQTNLLK